MVLYWCSSHYILVARVSRVELWVQFRDSAVLFLSSTQSDIGACSCRDMPFWSTDPNLKFGCDSHVHSTSHSREGKQQKLAVFAQKKDEWVRIFVDIHMELRPKFYCFWLRVHTGLYHYLIADVRYTVSRSITNRSHVVGQLRFTGDMTRRRWCSHRSFGRYIICDCAYTYSIVLTAITVLVILNENAVINCLLCME